MLLTVLTAVTTYNYVITGLSTAVGDSYAPATHTSAAAAVPGHRVS